MEKEEEKKNVNKQSSDKKWRQKVSGPWRLPVRLNSEFSKVEKMRHLVDNRATVQVRSLHSQPRL